MGNKQAKKPLIEEVKLKKRWELRKKIKSKLNVVERNLKTVKQDLLIYLTL